MAEASSIQQSSLPWQLRQVGKNLSEWIQLRLAQWEPPAPDAPPNFEFPVWLGQFLFWLLVIGVIGWLAWLIVQLWDNYLGQRPERRAQPQVDFIVPPEHHTVAAWLRRAQQLERDGNWRGACRAWYMAALQLLHDREWIPHQPSRTDGEYLQTIQTLPRARPLQMLIRTHERSLFGGEALAADNVQRCRQAYEEMAQR
ncbi:DUF4129 domain-containing protein [Halomicronema sp. CCY15110]|uniref:DUF4129 domain-containing protein n=1 Tax=Halomicronema sp. CCY15110 TaxID=2767773 RepID=UPI00194F7D28|nr:DUF4129 domain-containing protein [Halomicronema sp. CCY15110]